MSTNKLATADMYPIWAPELLGNLPLSGVAYLHVLSKIRKAIDSGDLGDIEAANRVARMLKVNRLTRGLDDDAELDDLIDQSSQSDITATIEGGLIGAGIWAKDTVSAMPAAIAKSFDPKQKLTWAANMAILAMSTEYPEFSSTLLQDLIPNPERAIKAWRDAHTQERIKILKIEDHQARAAMQASLETQMVLDILSISAGTVGAIKLTSRVIAAQRVAAMEAEAAKQAKFLAFKETQDAALKAEISSANQAYQERFPDKVVVSRVYHPADWDKVLDQRRSLIAVADAADSENVANHQFFLQAPDKNGHITYGGDLYSYGASALLENMGRDAQRLNHLSHAGSWQLNVFIEQNDSMVKMLNEHIRAISETNIQL